MQRTESSLPLPIAFLILFFLGFMGVLTLVDMLDGPNDARSERIARTPELPRSPGNLPRYLADARYYLSNRYAWRKTFVEANAAIKLKALGHVPYADVILGRDKFLFLATEGVVPMTQGLEPFEEADELAWAAYFDALAEGAASYDLPFLFILAPNKHDVYAEFLPGWLKPQEGPARRFDQVLGFATERLPVAPLNLKAFFEDLRLREPQTLFYHPTDTHWNELGAALALQAALKTVGVNSDLPLGTALEELAGGDLARMIGRQDQTRNYAPLLPRDGSWSCVTSEGEALDIVTIDPLFPLRISCSGTGRQDMRLVAFVDSFGMAAIPFLASNFKQLEIFWQDETDFLKAHALDADLVVRILVARRVQTASPADFTVIYNAR